MTLLAGSLLTSTVNLVIWREPGVAPPCDVHAVLATNLSKHQFKAVVKKRAGGSRSGLDSRSPILQIGTCDDISPVPRSTQSPDSYRR